MIESASPALRKMTGGLIRGARKMPQTHLVTSHFMADALLGQGTVSDTDLITPMLNDELLDALIFSMNKEHKKMGLPQLGERIPRHAYKVAGRFGSLSQPHISRDDVHSSWVQGYTNTIYTICEYVEIIPVYAQHLAKGGEHFVPDLRTQSEEGFNQLREVVATAVGAINSPDLDPIATRYAEIKAQHLKRFDLDKEAIDLVKQAAKYVLYRVEEAYPDLLWENHTRSFTKDPV